MKRFIITEEEKKSILNLYEKIGDKLLPGSENSGQVKQAKKIATFLNQYYRLNMNAATTGNVNDKDYNEAIQRFLEEKKIPIWVCKTGDGYCPKNSDGQVTAKEGDFSKFMDYVEGSPNNQQQTQNQKFNTTFENYDYKLENGKYYFRGKGNLSKIFPNWVDVDAMARGLDAIKKNVKF